MDGARRVPWGLVWPLLVGLGAMLLTVAALLAFVVVPAQARTPLDLDGRIVCTGRGDVLDSASLGGPRLITDHDVPLSYRQQATVVEPSDRERITVELATSVLRTDRPEKDGLVQATLHRVTMDRVTALPAEEGMNGSIATEDGRPSVPLRVDGIELKFPLDTRRQTYPFYDTTARAAHSIDYVDDGEVSGLRTYHFHQRLPPTDLTRVDPSTGLDLPASTLGLPGVGDVHVRTYYTVDRDYQVEPTTGTVVDAVERIHQYLGRTPGEELVTLFRFDAKMDPDSVGAQVSQARDGLDSLRTWGLVVPVVLAGVGAVAVAVGTIGGLRGGRRGRPRNRRPARGKATAVPAGTLW